MPNEQADYMQAITSGIQDIKALMGILERAIDDKERRATETVNWGHVGDLQPIIKNLKEAIASTGYYEEKGD